MKHKKLSLPFIGCDVHIARVDDIVKYRNDLRKKYPLLPPYESKHIGGLCTYDYDNYPHIIWITLETKPKLTTIIHETSHAIDHIFETWGFEDTELRAYLQSWFVEEIMK